MSGTRLITPFEITTSAQPSATGSDSASPSRNSTFPSPGSLAAWRAISSIAGVMSTPTTAPSGPTARAAMSASIPAPDPMSTTRSPGAGSPQWNGFETPAKEATACSGRPTSHSSRYPAFAAARSPVWKWNVALGCSTTSRYLS